MIRHAGDDYAPPSRCSLLGGLFGGGGSSSSAAASTTVTVNPNITNVIELDGVEKVLATIHADNLATSRTQLAGTLLAAERQAQAQEAAAATTSQVNLERLSQLAAVLVAGLTVYAFWQGKRV